MRRGGDVRVLVVDMGNTNVKFAIAEGGALVSQVREAAYDVAAAAVLALAVDGGAAGCLVSSVVGRVDELAAPLRRAGIGVVRLDAAMRLPFVVDYVAPQSLGSDRVAGAAGVWAMWGPTDALVIDAGTAITYDFLSADGHFRGGAISPGVSMRFRALHSFTAKLPLCDVSCWDGGLVARDTCRAVASGVMNGVLAEARRFIDLARRERPATRVVLTGGDYKNFDLTSEKGIFANPNLVLKGLAFLAKENLDLVVRGVSA